MNERALSFLKDSSDRTLQDFELMKRANAANLAKQLRSLLDEVVNELVEAELARTWREARKPLASQSAAPVESLLLNISEE